MAPLETIRNFDLYDIELDVDRSVSLNNTSVVPLHPQVKPLHVDSNEFFNKSIFDYPVIVDDEGVPSVSYTHLTLPTKA